LRQQQRSLGPDVQEHAQMVDRSIKEDPVTLRKVDRFHDALNGIAETLGKMLVDAFHYLALFAIGGTIVWSAVVAFLGMGAKGHAAIDDILLLFIYLELGAMVGIYFKTNHMPVRFLIYVAMTALTRLLISDVQLHHPPDMGIVLVSGAILLLALATLVIRYGSSKFPSVHVDGGES
jgi:phosphate starvation-inducible membrane PsiE